MALADMPRAAALGFQTGMQMGEGQNPLGQFVKLMLADFQQKRELQTEYGMKKGLLKEEYNIKAGSPFGIAELAKTQAETGLKEEELKTYREAKKKYEEGDRSPAILKTLGMYATPNILNFMGSEFPIGNSTITNNEPTPMPFTGGKPKYDPKTQKLQYNSKTGEYRVVSKSK